MFNQRGEESKEPWERKGDNAPSQEEHEQKGSLQKICEESVEAGRGQESQSEGRGSLQHAPDLDSDRLQEPFQNKKKKATDEKR